MKGSPANLQVTGYLPGVIGKITELHAVYYHRNWGFDASFETQVGEELSEFIREYQRGRDGFWVGWINDRFAGSVAVDARGAGETGARLRWLIVEPEFQGLGVGAVLVDLAVGFCREQGYDLYLWTFEGLEAARHLYESRGLVLTREHRVDQWGATINEQLFELKCGEAAEAGQTL